MRKRDYKYHIEKALKEEAWEVKSINSSGKWWDDEHWKVEYKYDSKLSFYLCFIVDPMFEGKRKKGQGIYEIKALTQFPSNWNDDENIIASLNMMKGIYDRLNALYRCSIFFIISRK